MEIRFLFLEGWIDVSFFFFLIKEFYGFKEVKCEDFLVLEEGLKKKGLLWVICLSKDDIRLVVWYVNGKDNLKNVFKLIFKVIERFEDIFVIIGIVRDVDIEESILNWVKSIL